MERYKRLSEEAYLAFKQAATKFTRTLRICVASGHVYRFRFTQAVYIYLTDLLRKLSHGKEDKDVYLADDVALEYKRTQKISEESIELEKTGSVALDSQKHNVGGPVEDEKVRLSTFLEKLNYRFGTQFTETEFLSRGQVKEDMLNSEGIRQKVANNVSP